MRKKITKKNINKTVPQGAGQSMGQLTQFSVCWSHTPSPQVSSKMGKREEIINLGWQ
jgi:hypothetical protein